MGLALILNFTCIHTHTSVWHVFFCRNSIFSTLSLLLRIRQFQWRSGSKITFFFPSASANIPSPWNDYQGFPDDLPSYSFPFPDHPQTPTWDQWNEENKSGPYLSLHGSKENSSLWNEPQNLIFLQITSARSFVWPTPLTQSIVNTLTSSHEHADYNPTCPKYK